MVTVIQTSPTPAKKAGETQPRAGAGTATVAKRQFGVLALAMSGQLAVAVLVPIIGGVELDKALGTTYVCTLCGLALALILSGVVMWRTMRAANRLPVPKLTAAQKRAIKKSYEEDDD